MKKSVFLCISLLILLGVCQYSFAQPARLTYLKDVNVSTSADSTKIVLRFNGPSQERGIMYRDKFIQVEFPDTVIDPSKQWFNVNDELIKRIFVYQFDDYTVRVRLFTVGKAGNLKDKIIISKEDDKIIIQYKLTPEAGKTNLTPLETIHNVNGQLSAVSNQVSDFSSQNQGTRGSTARLTPAITDVSETKTENNEQKPVNNEAAILSGKNQLPPVIEQSSNKEEQSGVNMPIGIQSPGIYSSFLRMLMALGVIISLLLVTLFMVKKYFGKKMGITDKNQGIRIITSAYLGPKKSIALVDVSGERIVVGITPNHISMLTRLTKDIEFNDILKEQISSDEKSDEKVVLHDELWEKA